jgi:hypothetical protein
LINYFLTQQDTNGTRVILTQRKTGFLGFIISLKNVFEVFEIIQQYHMDYLLTFKLSQDFIEPFFSCIRGRGGFNNNPNAQ